MTKLLGSIWEEAARWWWFCGDSEVVLRRGIVVCQVIDELGYFVCELKDKRERIR